MGRPSKLTHDVADALVTATEAGLGYRDAAAAAAISPTTLMTWLARGRRATPADDVDIDPADPDRPYVALWDRLSRARAAATAEMTSAVRNAAVGGDWRAAAWWLDRRQPYLTDPGDAEHLNPEELADKQDAALTEAQAREVATAMTEFGRSLLRAVEDDGVQAARMRAGPLAAEALIGEHDRSSATEGR